MTLKTMTTRLFAAIAMTCLLAMNCSAEPAPFRRLGGGSSSSPSPPPAPDPIPFVYTAPPTPTECNAAIAETSSANYLESGNSDKETNWNDAKFGHAKYQCVEPMIRKEKQYVKALSYAWCVYPHCETDCPGSNCPIHDTVAKCQSAVKNWLGYAARKQATPDFAEAERYYDSAIALWPENCGALGYRAELELQKGDVGRAKMRLMELCELSACSGHDAVRESATEFWTRAGLSSLPSECDWAIGLDQTSGAVSLAVSFLGTGARSSLLLAAVAAMTMA
eukprot:gnl/TRDRNA2_/TRDRNA2_88781_c0_seq1.p1 gnl/TRDRNA2_/TRDRNA2_88781_c0~~gnl/TRDRNA2_/TRDRNA2_88781_c0_seq1.p1  ORF type:complete len:279 (+),score=33.65 gnl/TRDRNA2_/TRDRNA2_88781_c0_seq1:78-914(+)